MRSFIYYSKTAPTSGKYINEKNLMASGRIDIAVHTVIAAFFLSHQFRNDVKLHLCFAGHPDPEKHLELKPITEGKTDIDKIYLSKKDIAWVLKRMLFKYKKDKKIEVFPGYWIEKKHFLNLIEELYKQGGNIYLLDEKGENIEEMEIKENPIFILGDHHGLPKKELKKIKKFCTTISLGKRTYFASQSITIVNYELDRREDLKMI